jgi:hypothetical protein
MHNALLIGNKVQFAVMVRGEAHQCQVTRDALMGRAHAQSMHPKLLDIFNADRTEIEEIARGKLDARTNASESITVTAADLNGR